MIATLFAHSGQDAYFGEPVTQLEHALQSAQLAEQAGADRETIVAAFLHDIGHLLPPETNQAYMDDYGTVDHERLAGGGLSARAGLLGESNAVAREPHQRQALFGCQEYGLF